MENENQILPKCPVCEKSNGKYVTTHMDFNESEIYFCLSCNHWFTYPEPGELKLNQYYNEIYSPQRRRYFGEEYNALMQRRAKAQKNFISNYLTNSEKHAMSHFWKILDWGCGVGALVALFQKAGANIVGYDSDKAAIEVGKRLWNANISTTSSNAVDLHQDQFNLLLLSHIVEHLPNIQKSLQELIKVLKPGGIVFIEIPNSDSDTFDLKSDHESHINFFSRQSIDIILTKLGLQVLGCVVCGPPKRKIIDKRSNKLSTPMMKSINRIRRFMNYGFNLLGFHNKRIKTIYDGFFDYYPSDNNGLWIRCLARVPI